MRRQNLLLAAVMAGLLLAMLDQTIVGTAIPRIVEDLHGTSLYVWLVTAYLVPATVSLPVYARLSDRYGRRALLLTGMTIFLIGSALAASAGDMTQLIAFRGVQGLGAGALEGLSFILVADLFAGRRSASLQAAMAGLMGISFIAGPLIGGFLTDHVGWRSVFTVNLPIGIAALVIVATVLPRELGRHEQKGAPLDIAGIALLTGAVGLVLVGLSTRSHGDAAGHLPGWVRVDTGGLIVAGLVLLAAFAVVERRAAAPLIPLALVTGRRTAPIMLAATTGIFGLIVGVFLLPRYFQTARDVSATDSGLLIYPLLIGLLISVNLAGAATMRLLDFRTPILAGAGLAIVGAAGFATFDASTPDWVSLIFMGLIGLGVGPTLSGLQIGIQRTVQPQMIATTMGTLILLRQVGVSIALAAAATLYAGGVAGDPGQAAAATSTGHAVFAVTLFGAVVSAAALLALPRNATKLAPARSGTGAALPAQ